MRALQMSDPVAQGDGKTEELLSCPFCGNQPSIAKGILECTTCEFPFFGRPGVTLGEMIAKWNKRVSPGTAANKTEADSGIKEAHKASSAQTQNALLDLQTDELQEIYILAAQLRAELCLLEKGTNLTMLHRIQDDLGRIALGELRGVTLNENL